MDDFIKYLLVTDQLDEVFWGKEKEEQEEDNLKRTLTKKEEQKDFVNKNKRSSSK